MKEKYKNINGSKYGIRYYGAEMQVFAEKEYEVVEAVMLQVSREKCLGTVAVWANPTQYFVEIINQWGK